MDTLPSPGSDPDEAFWRIVAGEAHSRPEMQQGRLLGFGVNQATLDAILDMTTVRGTRDNAVNALLELGLTLATNEQNEGVIIPRSLLTYEELEADPLETPRPVIDPDRHPAFELRNGELEHVPCIVAAIETSLLPRLESVTSWLGYTPDEAINELIQKGWLAYAAMQNGAFFEVLQRDGTSISIGIPEDVAFLNKLDQ